MADIKNSFTDIATYVNAANLDATYMSAAVFAPPRTIECRSVNVISGDLASASGSKHYVGGGTYFLPSGPQNNFAPIGIQFDPADHAITGKTLGLRLVISTAFCDNVPAGNLIFGLYPASIASTNSGLFAITMGTATASVTKTPTADTISVDSVTFSAPVAGTYCFGAASVTPYVGYPFAVTYRLEARYT
jgi:hypothetical protein